MRRHYSPLIAAVTAALGVPVSAAPNYADVVLADSPTAYYRLSETSGTTVADSAGSFTGTLGAAGVDLTAAGPDFTTFTGFEAGNSAGSFDRASQASINLGTPLTAALNGAPAITLELWMDDVGADVDTQYVAAWVGMTTGSGGTTTGANLRVRNGLLRVGGRSATADGFRAGANVALTPAEMTEWTQMVGVLDFANAAIRTYVNGELVDETLNVPFASTTFDPGVQEARISGATNATSGTANEFTGLLDEVAFYNRALTDAEVLAHYNAALVGGSGGIDGDYNDSGLVEQGDLDQVLANWGADFSSIPGTWVNQRPAEGIVDQAELDVVLTEWGSSSAPSFAGSAVPEPASLALLGSACVLFARRRTT